MSEQPLAVNEIDTSAATAAPRVRLGGANGTEGVLTLMTDRGKLVWRGSNSVLVVDFTDIGLVDDVDDARAELIVVSDKRGELCFDFGATGSAMATLYGFEVRLQEAIQLHAEATSQAVEQQTLERALRTAVVELEAKAKKVSGCASTRESICKRTGCELRTALTEINQLSDCGKLIDARERMAAVVTADSACSPANLLKYAAARQHDSAGKWARGLRDQLFSVVGLHMAKETLRSMLKMPLVQLQLDDSERRAVALSHKEATDVATAKELFSCVKPFIQTVLKTSGGVDVRRCESSGCRIG